MYKIRLYFENNYSFEDNKTVDLLFLPSFAKALMWLYSDEADGPREQNYNLDGKIKLYQLVNTIAVLLSFTHVELGEASIKEAINDMKKGKGHEWRDGNYNDIYDFTSDKGEAAMAIKWATHELVMSILWGGYIYCQTLIRLGHNNWMNASDIFYRILKSESCLKDNAFKRNWLIKHTDEMVETMLSDIKKRQKQKMETNANQCSVPSLHEKLKKQEAHIKELEKEIDMLKQQTNSNSEPEKNRLDFLEDWQKLSTRELAIFFAQALGVSFNPDLINKTQLANLAGKWTEYEPDSIRTKISDLFKEDIKVNKGELDGYSRKTKDEALDVYYFIIKIAKYYSSITPQMNNILDNINMIYNLGIDEPKKKEIFDTIDKARKSGEKSKN